MKQVFQTHTSSRWNKFKWTIWLFAACIIVGAVISLISVYTPNLPALPRLTSAHAATKKVKAGERQPLNTTHPASVTDKKHSPGNASSYYRLSDHAFVNKTQNDSVGRIKAAFYVNWDLQSYYSLRENIDRFNTVMPEWFMLNDGNDSISTDIDPKALALMQAHNVRIIPMLTNFFNGHWNGHNVNRVINSEEGREKIIQSVVDNLKKYHFHGVNVDFEDLIESTDEYIILFQKELYEELHKNNFIVTQDIPPGNTDFNIEELQHYNDYLVIMAYDQHHPSTAAGTIASIKWVEGVMDRITGVVPADKIILGVCAYGYDWVDNKPAQDISYAKAMAAAIAHNCDVIYDPATYSVHINFTDDTGSVHNIYFSDAVSAFNIMRLGYEYNVSGFAAWRLGEEDARLWTFFNKKLDRTGIPDIEAFANELKKVTTKDNVTYTGEGDIMDVVITPTPGAVSLQTDATDKLICGEQYEKLPYGYVVNKTGKTDKKVVLSFDDGPDERYTPEVIRILEREHVTASFFLLGLNAQGNIPLVKKLYENGYELGNHSFTHVNFSTTSTERIQLELRSTRRFIECVTGRSSVLFRPPFNGDENSEGADDIYPMAVSKDEHFYTIASSIDPRDWEKGSTAEEIIQRVKNEEEKGNIILLHDGGGKREETVKALPEIIHYFKSKGYTFTSIAGLMGKTRNDVMPLELSVKDKCINALNLLIASSFFYSNKLMSSIFLCAILLVMLRTFIIAVLALIQVVKSRAAKKSSVISRQLAISSEHALDGTSPFTLHPSPLVSVIVPAHNEEATIIKTVETLLLSDYENLEIIAVDDGSTDATYDKLIARFNGNLRVHVHSKPNGGKATALNFGIQEAGGAIVVCIDADTQLRSDAISELLHYFDDEKTAAVAGNVKVGNENNWLTKWQSIEYITGQNFDRRAFDLLNCITIIPGAIGAFRKECVLKAGGFSHSTLAEDCDLTMQLLEEGYTVKYSPKALAFTEAPETFAMFLKQRFRWTFGVLQSFWKHRSSLFNPKAGTMGMIAMPNILLFQFILPAIAPFVDILMIWGLFHGQGMQLLGYYFLFIAIDAAGALLAFSFEDEKTGRLWLIIPQRIVYRWLMGFVLYKALIKAMRGEMMGWGKLKRTGNVEMEPVPAINMQSYGAIVTNSNINSSNRLKRVFRYDNKKDRIQRNPKGQHLPTGSPQKVRFYLKKRRVDLKDVE